MMGHGDMWHSWGAGQDAKGWTHMRPIHVDEAQDMGEMCEMQE